MRHGGVSILLAAVLLAGCAESFAPPGPEPPPALPLSVTPAAVQERPRITLTERIQQEGWIIRFWEQLTPAQRRRVANALRHNIPPIPLAEEAEAAPIWDALGLPERDALIFGRGVRSLRPAASPGTEAAQWSRGSSPAPDSSAPR